MKKWIIIVCFLWTAVIAGFLFFSVISARDNRQAVHLQSARSFFNQIEITRSWNSLHDGVYVPISSVTRPNPYLEIPMRDIVVNPHLTLTKINPALMTREISRLTEAQDGVIFRITSLNPLNPQNQPTEQEKSALALFDQGKTETWAFYKNNSTPFFFYMAPLITNDSCLQCHEKQGYRKGDIRGGISITMPALAQISRMKMITAHILLLAVGLVGIVFFGMALTRAHQALEHQAAMDALTGLFNRRRFSERITIEFAACRRKNALLSLIMCDVDHFKQFNDTYGHQAGDDCLVRIAAVLKQALKRPADFCARYGGEEFIVVLPDTSENGALHVAERIRQTILDLGIPHEHSKIKKISLSLGVVTRNPSEVSGHEAMIIQADEALYQAKARGRNRVECFAPEEEQHPETQKES